MRRLLLPLAILAVAVAASVLAARADDDAAGDASGPVGLSETPAAPLLSATRAPEWLRQPEADKQLGLATANVLSSIDPPPARSCVAVHREGVEVANVNATAQSLTPGALQRLITAAAAFELLPADDSFSTDVVTQVGVVPVDGVLDAGLWIVGRGDPGLSTADYIDRFADDRARTSFEELADDVVAELQRRGITTIVGSVLGDESRFPIVQRDYEGIVWNAGENAANTVGPLSALLLNDGFTTWPATVDQAANERAADPPAAAAARFTGLLAERGIIVEGAPGSGDAPDLRDVLAQTESPPLASLVGRAMRDGTTAEMLIKELGLRMGTDGQISETMVALFLGPVGRLGLPIPSDDGTSLLADGSGLSDQNLVSCAALAEVLVHPDVGEAVVEAMPTITTTDLAACAPIGADDMRVLSSVANDTTGVAGVFTADNGDRISFVTMANEPGLGSALGPCNPLQASMLDAVAGHPYGPPLEDLVPTAGAAP